MTHNVEDNSVVVKITRMSNNKRETTEGFVAPTDAIRSIKSKGFPYKPVLFSVNSIIIKGMLKITISLFKF